jgi:hypothetical protein
MIEIVSAEERVAVNRCKQCGVTSRLVGNLCLDCTYLSTIKKAGTLKVKQ